MSDLINRPYDCGISFLANHYLPENGKIYKKNLSDFADKNTFSHLSAVPMDYILTLIISLYDYYMYFGDTDFLEEIYPAQANLTDFVLSRRNSAGYLELHDGEFEFLDLSDADKNSCLCCQQILLLKALDVMAEFSSILKKQDKYSDIAKALKKQIFFDFWDGVFGFRHSDYEHLPTKHGNIFAIYYGYLHGDAADFAVKASLKNESVATVNNPYLKFYELCALCNRKEFESAEKELASRCGGTDHDTYSPHIFEKYFLGVKPTKPGFEEYEISPCTATAEHIKGSVSTPKGNIDIFCSDKEIIVKPIPDAKGVLTFETDKKVSGYDFISDGNNKYHLELNSDKEIRISLE